MITMPQRKITDLTNPQKDYSKNRERQAISCVHLSIKDDNDNCKEKGIKCCCIGLKKNDCKCSVGHKHYLR